MSGPLDHGAEASRWLRFAQEDLTDARGLLARNDSTPRNICWTAMQGAEKAIKAILIFEGIRFPRIHDLDRLIQLVPAGWTVTSPPPDLTWLSGWSPDTRYPDDLDEATRPDAERAVDIASEAVAMASADLGARGVTPTAR